MALHDSAIERYGNIRKSKLAGASADPGVDAQEYWEDECIQRAEATVAAALLQARGYAAITAAARDEAGAGGALTTVSSDVAASSLTVSVNGTSGDFTRLETDVVWQQDRGPELEARIRYAAGAADMTSSRFEIGFYRDLGAPSRNSPVAYAAIVRETQRNNDNFRLHVAGTDYFCMTLNAGEAAATELTNETVDIQDADLNDVIIGINDGAAGAAVIDDGLIFINPRPPKAIVLTVGTAETAVHTYAWEYFGILAGGAARAWRALTPDGTAPTFIAGGTGVGRKVMEIPQTIVDLMRQFQVLDVVGIDATTANVPAAVTVIGNYGVRVRTTAVGAGAAPLLNWASVEEIVDIGIAPTENTWHRLRLRVGSGSGDPAQARVDDTAWATSPQGAMDAGTTPVLRMAAKCQTFAAAAKRLDIDYWRAFQNRTV